MVKKKKEMKKYFKIFWAVSSISIKTYFILFPFLGFGETKRLVSLKTNFFKAVIFF